MRFHVTATGSRGLGSSGDSNHVFVKPRSMSWIARSAPRLPSFAIIAGYSKLHHKARITLRPTVPGLSGRFEIGLITRACDYYYLLVGLHEIPHGLSLSRQRTAPDRRRDLLLGILPHWTRYLYDIACCTIRPQPTRLYKDACRLIQVPVRLLLKLDRYCSHILPCRAPGRRTSQRFSFVQV